MRASEHHLREFRSTLEQFGTDIGAATAIEYALIAAGVGAAVAGAVYNLGSTVEDTLYNKIDAAMK